MFRSCNLSAQWYIDRYESNGGSLSNSCNMRQCSFLIYVTPVFLIKYFILYKLNIPLLILSSLLSFIVCNKSFLFKSSSTTLKNSTQAVSPFNRSIFSIFDFLRLVPVQRCTSAISGYSNIGSIRTIVSSSVYGSSSWRRVKLCWIQRAGSPTKKQVL